MMVENNNVVYVSVKNQSNRVLWEQHEELTLWASQEFSAT